MIRKPKRNASPLTDPGKDLWINPRSNLRGPDGNRSRNAEGNIRPTDGARFLELADVALGIKKPPHRKRKGVDAQAKKTGSF